MSRILFAFFFLVVACQAPLAPHVPLGKAIIRVLPQGRLAAQALEIDRVNRIQLTIEGTGNAFKQEVVVPLSLGSSEATVNVPFGNNFVVTAQGLDDTNSVAGVMVKGVFSMTSQTTVSVTLTPKTTPTALIVEGVRAKDATLAGLIDTASLQTLVDRSIGNAHPSLLHIQNFVDAILAARTLIDKAPGVSRMASGKVTGTIEGLDNNEVAVITVSDPSSQPTVVVGGGDETSYVVDNVTPGQWTVRIAASGYSTEDAADQAKTVTIGNVQPSPSPGATPDPSATPLTPASAGDSVLTAKVDFTLVATAFSSTPHNVSSNVGPSDQLAMTIDGVNQLHAVWRQDFNEDDNASGQIFYSRWNGTSWSQDNRNISASNASFKGARAPSVAVGVDRLPHVVWSGLSESDLTRRFVLYSHFDGTTWSKPVSINANDGKSTSDPKTAVDKINGHVYAVWSGDDNTRVYFTQNAGTKWETPFKLSNTAGEKPSIATGFDGSIHVIWRKPDTAEIYHVYWNGNKWSSTARVPFPTVVNTDDQHVTVAVDRLNRAHMVWRVGDDIYTLYFHNGSYSAAEQVNLLANATTLDATSPCGVFVNPVGHLYLAWISDEALRFRRRTNLGWDATAETIPGSAGTPTTARPAGDLPFLAQESTGVLHILWSHLFPTSSGVDEYEVMHSVRKSDGD